MSLLNNLIRNVQGNAGALDEAVEINGKAVTLDGASISVDRKVENGVWQTTISSPSHPGLAAIGLGIGGPKDKLGDEFGEAARRSGRKPSSTQLKKHVEANLAEYRKLVAQFLKSNQL